MNIGVIGCGHWGSIIIKKLTSVSFFKVRYICDLQEERLQKLQMELPGIKYTTSDYQTIINDPEIDAVIIATTAHTHFQIARDAILAKKHVLVEKPITTSLTEAEELYRLAQENKRVLMTDHILIFSEPIRKIQTLIKEGVLGKIQYIESTRANLGLFQDDVNVLWDLAPHDFSVTQFILGMQPESVIAVGKSHLKGKKEDIAYVNLFYPDNLIVHFSLSWISPIKIRRLIIGGDEQMLEYDENRTVESIKVFDTKVRNGNNNSVDYLKGPVVSPKYAQADALESVFQHFHQCINNKTELITDGNFAAEVVRTLEAADESMKNDGKRIFYKFP